MPADALYVNEIFHSIQGESSWAGLPCTFVRLRGCPLRCHYCDTTYAFHEGKRMSLDAVIAAGTLLSGGSSRLWQLTGGEPLMQAGAFPLITRLCDQGITVLIETSGAVPIAACDPRSIRILDIKTPGSGECARNRLENLVDLRPHDEVKFVLTSREDYDWMREMLAAERLHERVHAVLVSAAAPMAPDKHIQGCPGLDLRTMVEWVLADRLPVRVQTQLHKIIWDPKTRGV